MVKEEERQLLVDDNRVPNKESISTLSLASFIVSVFALFASLATIVVTVRTNDKTNVLTERLNSKEYQISENLKFDLIELVAVLRAIDSKAMTALFVDNYEIDYSNELQMLKNIQTRPGYLVFLHSIESDRERKKVEIYVQNFIDYFLSSPTTSSTDIRQQVHKILDYIGNADLKGSLNMDFEDLLNDLCLTETVFHFRDEYVEVEHEERYCDFVRYLLHVKCYDDPDLEYFYSYFCEPDTLKAKKAVEDGATCEDLEISHELPFWKWYLWREIEENYSDEYHAFCKRR